MIHRKFRRIKKKRKLNLTYIVRVKRTSKNSQSIVSILSTNNQLCDHRVIVYTDLIAFDKASFKTHIGGSLRGMNTQQRSSIWKEVTEMEETVRKFASSLSMLRAMDPYLLGFSAYTRASNA
jgi:hypothetical protein